MSYNQSRYYIFSDESGWDADCRFGSLAKISGTYENTFELNKILQEILDRNCKDEIKFKVINNQRNKQIAIEFIDASLYFLNTLKIKIHVIVWDKHDSRHNIQNRCDIENLKRMYYHNMKNLIRSWNVEADWSFYPDEFTAIDWNEDVVKYVQNTNFSPKSENELLLFEAFSKVNFPSVKNVRELESNKYPIIQLADLYAGMIRTSRVESKDFSVWCRSKDQIGQASLFEEETTLSISNSLRPKFEVMYDFKKKVSRLSLGVNFSNSLYFKSFNNKNGICIWHYEPQHHLDKAPTKIKKS